MTPAQFADHVLSLYPDFTACHVAVIRASDAYTLEVEISEGTIAGCYDADTRNLEKARRLADELDRALAARGVTVFPSRPAWEDHLNKETTP